MYLNITSMIVSGVSGVLSYTTDITFQNFDNGSIQFNWTGFNVTGTPYVQVSGSNDQTNFSTLPVGTGFNNPSTMNAAAGSYLFNITDAGYNWVRVLFKPLTNTGGTTSVVITRKSRR